MKKYHCWFSKTASFYWLQDYKNNPLYRLEDGREVEVSCVTSDSGDFATDKAATAAYLFPDSVYLGIGTPVKAGIPIKPIKMLSFDSPLEDTQAVLKELTSKIDKMKAQIAKAKLENN
jgi:hypothetical protein